MNNNPPESHELEVSLFGPGVGESVVAHLGDGDWIVIDSCRDRKSSQPAALQYLASLGVDVANQVKLVVATHWYNDHINGLAEILRAAKSARFVNSGAYSIRELARLARLGVEASLSAATKEYSDILDLLVERRKPGERTAAIGPMQAVANKKLLTLPGIGKRTVTAEVFALSPADGVMNRAHAELQSALADIKLRRSPAATGPNQLCVTIWLKVGALDALLGADLEHVPGRTGGWQAIVESGERPAGHAGVFKVPHHGSKNADCPDGWTTLLRERPVALLTPNTPARLPKPDDLARLCTRTSDLYLTGSANGYSAPRRDNAVEKTLREMNVDAEL